MYRGNRLYWLAQFLGWTAYCSLLTLSAYNESPNRINQTLLINVVILIFAGVLATHVQRIAFIRMGWLSMRLPRLIPRLLFSSILTSMAIAAIDISTDLLTNYSKAARTPSEMVVVVLATMALVVPWNAIYFTFHFFQKSRQQEISNLELAASKRESELKNLRSQLNPHFLFNSLNSIRALVDIEPTKAKKSITTLSNLLRQSLVLGKENLVNLESELNVAKSYLDLEKIRFEERLRVEWEIDADLEEFQVPPFSLQMMVENAIKHGISNLKEGGLVKIKAYREDQKVVVEVINTGDLSEVVDLGVGIQNVKRRLALQYGNKASFSLKELKGFVVAKMSFNNERI